MMKVFYTRVVVSFLCSAILFNLAWAHKSIAESFIELVQSVPVETTLKVPGVRETQEVWLEMIRSAKSKIDIEQFYVSEQKGEMLTPILEAIQEAGRRNVKVRLLVDSEFYSNYPETVDQLNKFLNIQVRKISFSKTHGVQHSKFFVVDNEQSFVGSQNFDWRALNQIHEIGLKIRDAQVAHDLESVFEVDWNQGGGTHESTNRETLLNVREIDLVSSPPSLNPTGRGDSLSTLLNLIQNAQSSIRIQVMDYSTRTRDRTGSWLVLDQALRQASARNVKVELLVDSGHASKSKRDLEELSKLKNIEVRIVTIPNWSGGSIPYARLVHSKYLLVDQSVGWVGTENWSKDYFMNSRNVGIVFRTPEVLEKLTRVFCTVWQSSYSSPVH